MPTKISVFVILIFFATLIAGQTSVWSELNSKTKTLIDQGRYEDALAPAKAALEIAERSFGPNDTKTAESLNNLGAIYLLQGKYLQADEPLQRAVKIREEKLGPNHSDTVDSINNLGTLYFYKGDYVRAKALHERSLEIRERILGPDDPLTAASYDNLAMVYEHNLDYVRAEEFYSHALTIREKTLGPNDRETGRSLNSLGTFYYHKGDYSQAERFLERALATEEKILGPNHPDIAYFALNVAEIYRTDGDYVRAETLFNRAITVAENTLGSAHPILAAALSGLAEIYRVRADYEQAEPLYKRALEITQTTLGKDHPFTASSLNNLAALYFAKEDYDQAEPLYQEALVSREGILGPEHPETATSVANLASLFLARGDYARAQTFYQRALAIEQKSLGPDHPQNVLSLNGLALCAWGLRRPAEAEDYFSRELKVEEVNLRRFLASSSESKKQAYLNTFLDTTQTLISFALTARPNAPVTGLAFTAITQRKARTLAVVASEMSAIRRRLSGDQLGKLDEIIQLRSALAHLYTEDYGRISAQDYKRETQELSEKEDQLESVLSAASTEFRANERVVTSEDIQRVLPAGVALVEFVRYRPYHIDMPHRWDSAHYAGFVALSDGPIVAVDLGEAEKIDTLCDQLTVSLHSRSNATQTSQIARELYTLVMQPLRSHLDARTEVLVSPDGELNLIPFSVLVDENNHYLLERYQFTYLGTSQDLLRLQQPIVSREAAYIVADPAFGTRERSLCYFEQRSGFLDEANEIAERLPGAKNLLGERASKAALQKLASPRILHVATHGFFDMSGSCIAKDAPAMLRSGIALAGANTRKNGDGIMTALEIADLDLQDTQLVVLSSCETGFGEVRSGEGVFGLRRALLIAGARTQILSLWEVDDEATRALMVGYYDRLLAGSGRSGALREVQLQMLHEGRDPSDWAAFIPSGDWTPLGK